MTFVVGLAARFLRLHFFTRSLMLFVASLIAWANTIPYYQDPEIVYAGYGWPYKFLELPTLVFRFPDGRMFPEKTHIFYTPEFVVNMLIAFALVGVLVVVLERVVWRHAIGHRAPANAAPSSAPAVPAPAPAAPAPASVLPAAPEAAAND
ncbi:MAG: hypothetical protein KIS92_20330 [Planctomycetota bacterium]|nr:hypothetical protein [Planctomycetota bacterium]